MNICQGSRWWDKVHVQEYPLSDGLMLRFEMMRQGQWALVASCLIVLYLSDPTQAMELAVLSHPES